MAATSVLAKKRATRSHFSNGAELGNLLNEAELRKENRRGDGSVESIHVLILSWIYSRETDWDARLSRQRERTY